MRDLVYVRLNSRVSPMGGGTPYLSTKDLKAGPKLVAKRIGPIANQSTVHPLVAGQLHVAGP